MNNLIQMNYNGNEIRTIDNNGQIWWVLKDVCKVMDIENHKDIPKRLEDDEVGRFELPHPQNHNKSIKTLCVNESGLYSVILRSDKPEAKPFRRWITHEVLPEIRRTGCYSLTESKKTKTWYGVPVLTISDIAEHMGICRDTVRKKITANLRSGLDYFILSGRSLQLFKFENRNVPVAAKQLILVREKEFFEYLNN